MANLAPKKLEWLFPSLRTEEEDGTAVFKVSFRDVINQEKDEVF